MSLGKSKSGESTSFIVSGFIGFVVSITLFIYINITQGYSLYAMGIVVVVGGFSSGIIIAILSNSRTSNESILTWTGGSSNFNESEDIVGFSAAIVGITQFMIFWFWTENINSLTAQPSGTIIQSIIVLIIGIFTGLSGFVFVSIFDTLEIPYLSNLIQGPRNAKILPRSLLVGVISRIPIIFYFLISVVILNREQVFEAVGQSPPQNEYFTMRADLTTSFGAQLRDDLPEVAEYTVALDFADYQRAIEFLDAFVTSSFVPSSLFGIITSLFGSLIFSVILYFIYFFLYYIVIVGIVELLLPFVILISVLSMIPPYKSKIPLILFNINFVLVETIIFTLILFGPLPIIGGGLTYQLGILGKLHILALITHMITGVTVLRVIDGPEHLFMLDHVNKMINKFRQ